MASPPPVITPVSEPLHTHSPALLRAAISNILAADGSRRSSQDNTLSVAEDWPNNMVVSHPPSPTSLPAELEPLHLTNSYRPLSLIIPLDPDSLRRIPLSHPPRTPPPAGETASSALKRSLAISSDEDYPLILVTGGAGFIGSHTVLEILQEGKYGVVVLDNFANSTTEVLSRVRLLSSSHHTSLGLAAHLHPPLYFHQVDIQSLTALSSVFALYSSSTSPKKGRFVAAIHFAALKSVPASIASPVSYYRVNVGGTLNLVECLDTWGCKRLVFSSSCVVYGAECDGEGIREEACDVELGASKGITNPYGRTKRMCEEILSDLSRSDPDWRTMSLRYTNPSGAHASGYIGEDPTNAANLMPIVTQVLQGKRDSVSVFGADYPTPDGTAVRDFIHVVDLAKAHLAAIRVMLAAAPESKRNSTYNLGTNKGTSVLTVIETLSLIAQRSIKLVVCPRRPGDLGCVVCSADKAERELGWKAELGFVEMCRDLVNWQALNPNGYATGRGENGKVAP